MCPKPDQAADNNFLTKLDIISLEITPAVNRQTTEVAAHLASLEALIEDTQLRAMTQEVLAEPEQHAVNISAAEQPEQRRPKSVSEAKAVTVPKKRPVVAADLVIKSGVERSPAMQFGVVAELDQQETEPPITLLEADSMLVRDEESAATTNADFAAAYFKPNPEETGDYILAEDNVSAETTIINLASPDFAQKQPDLVLNQATLDTFVELSLIIEAEQTPSPLLNQPEKISFEAYLDAQDEPEAVLSMEELRLVVTEQPFEQTLLQLSHILSSEATVENDKQVDEIKQALLEVMELLPELDIRVDRPQPEQLTPELTEKILLLLNSIGYKEPQSVLVDMVEEHGSDFLFQSLAYLCRIYDPKERWEIPSLATATPISITDENTLRIRLGTIILMLTAKLKIVPNL